MKCVCLVVSVLVGISALGQSVAELDKRNGFKEYTIGSNLSSIGESLQFIKRLEGKETKLFKAKESAIIDGMVGEVELAFYKERLVEITIFFQQKSLEEYDHLKTSLTQLYGNPVDESGSKNKPAYLSEYDRILMWKGSVIGLQYNYDVSHKVIEIVYWGLNETTEKAKEDF
jgi:hypothetical protein